jgi:Fe2+ transport system protein FeoA
MRTGQTAPGVERIHTLCSLLTGDSGVVVDVDDDGALAVGRLAALGVTRGARIRVLQTFPGIVVECDQTELVMERGVAQAVLVSVDV